MKVEEVCSTFPSMPTAVDGIQFSEGLETIGRVMDRGTLIRSHVAADLGSILHSRHQYHWHTGYEPPVNVAAPHLGAWIAHALGPKNPAVPAYIDIGQRYDGNGEAEELKAFQTGGVLGTEFGPFRVPDPADAVAAVRPPAGMTLSRFQSRYRGVPEAARGQPRSAATAPTTSASRCSARSRTPTGCSTPRPPRRSTSRSSRRPSYDIYNTGRFGLGCLLARRLVEAGRPLHRGHHRVHPVPQLGHPRQRPHPRPRPEEADRRPGRPAGPRPRSSAGCSTGR